MCKKRGIWQFYQPLRSGGVKQRSTETNDKALARRIEKLVVGLADDHRWAVLDTLGTVVQGRRITPPILYALSQSDPGLEDFEASLGATTLRGYLNGWQDDLLSQGRAEFTAQGAAKHHGREGWLFMGEGMVALSQNATPQALLAARSALLAVNLTSFRRA